MIVNYEPDRLIVDADRVIRLADARPEFLAAAVRSRRVYRDLEPLAARFTAWGDEQAAAGRPARELTFRNFVTETGILRPRPDTAG
jgi:hypothetical protein